MIYGSNRGFERANCTSPNFYPNEGGDRHACRRIQRTASTTAKRQEAVVHCTGSSEPVLFVVLLLILLKDEPRSEQVQNGAFLLTLPLSSLFLFQRLEAVQSYLLPLLIDFLLHPSARHPVAEHENEKSQTSFRFPWQLQLPQTHDSEEPKEKNDAAPPELPHVAPKPEHTVSDLLHGVSFRILP